MKRVRPGLFDAHSTSAARPLAEMQKPMITKVSQVHPQIR
jgi:hypothetical protein